MLWARNEVGYRRRRHLPSRQQDAQCSRGLSGLRCRRGRRCVVSASPGGPHRAPSQDLPADGNIEPAHVRTTREVATRCISATRCLPVVPVVDGQHCHCGVAGPSRGQRRDDHPTVDALGRQLPMELKARLPRLVARRRDRARGPSYLFSAWRMSSRLALQLKAAQASAVSKSVGSADPVASAAAVVTT